MLAEGEAEGQGAANQGSAVPTFLTLREGGRLTLLPVVVAANHHKLLDTSHRRMSPEVDKLLHGDENGSSAPMTAGTGVEKRSGACRPRSDLMAGRSTPQHLPRCSINAAPPYATEAERKI